MAWFREMLDLLRQYRQANKDYRASMRALRHEVKRLGREMNRG